jgi:transcriptional regulator with XRE-family HTH domain
MKKISERIVEGLELRGMRQADLVEKTGIGKSSISTYISGAYEPKQKNIYKIAKALNVSESWLMGYDVPMSREDETLKDILDDRIEELGISLESVANKADVPLNWLKNIDNFVPGETDDLKGSSRALDWNDSIGDYRSYEWITKVAEALDLPGSLLRAALARQEAAACDALSELSLEESEKGGNHGHGKDIGLPLFLSDEEKKHLYKYRKVDDKGKHTVDTVLEMEYNRCSKPHLMPVAAHNDDNSPEELEKMRRDLEDL